MKLNALLAWLSKQEGISLAEKRELPELGQVVYLFTSPLPFPYAKNKHAWAPLTVDQDQEDVDIDEIEALLRHLSQGQLEIPES